MDLWLMASERQRELLREAEEARLARQVARHRRKKALLPLVR